MFRPPTARITTTKRQEKRADDFNRHFADMVAYLDKLIGKLLARLGELGLLDNTVVLLRQWSYSKTVQFGTAPSRQRWMKIVDTSRAAAVAIRGAANESW